MGVVTVSMWFIFSGGLSFFNLDHARVYEFRRDVGSVIDVSFIAYLNNWAYSVFGPFLLIFFFELGFELFDSAATGHIIDSFLR